MRTSQVQSAKTIIWTAIYVIFLSIMVANYWVGFFMGVISPLPFMPGLTYFMPAISGALAYFFSKSVRLSIYMCVIITILSCFITAVVVSMPSYIGIVDLELGIYLALWTAVQMFLYVFPLTIGGCLVAAYLRPD